MNENKIIYHPSYSDEENEIIRDYIENASEKELVQMIRELQKLYTENVPEINETFKQLEKEVRARDILNQKRTVLKDNHSEWKSYLTALHNYIDVLSIRKSYASYKEKKKNLANFQNFYMTRQGIDIPYVCEDFVRKAVIPEGNKSFIEKPQAPHYYQSIDEIDVLPLNNDASLESIGKDNLKYTILLMLYNIDSLQEKNVPIALSFLTRRYAINSNHKGKGNLPVYTTDILSTPELLAETDKILMDIHKLKLDCQELLLEIENK